MSTPPGRERHLVVSATGFEVAPLFTRIGVDPLDPRRPGITRGSGNFDLLVCGVGQLQCAFHLATALAACSYSSVLNLGIGGSFREELPHRSVVSVREEALADLGAEDVPSMLDLFEMKLLDKDQPPFENGMLRASASRLESVATLPTVRSVTVNRVLALSESIRFVVDRYDPDVVNMEGAAVFYACRVHSVPVISIRSISDRVGPRDKSTWDIKGAIAALHERAAIVVEEIVTHPERVASRDGAFDR